MDSTLTHPSPKRPASAELAVVVDDRAASSNRRPSVPLTHLTPLIWVRPTMETR